MEIPDGTPDNTVRVTMTIPTQIQNQPLVSHMFLTFQISTRQSFAASATAGRVAATIHELQPIGGRKGVPFKKRGHSPDHLCSQVCLVVLSRPGSNLNRAFCAQLLQHQQSRIQVTRAAYTTSRGHCPSSRRVRLTHHIERHSISHRSTADLQSLSCTLRDRDVRSTWILLNGAACNHITKDTIDDSS